MKRSVVAFFAILVAACVGIPAAWAASGTHVMVAPDELKWSDVPSLPAGAKIAVIEGPPSEPVPFTFRLKFPANYVIPPHFHPAIEHVTVISGMLNMGAGDTLDRSMTKALSTGSAAIMPPGMHHFVWNKEETVVQVHGVGPWGITYINSADDPRKN